jgi:hypothetical protein
MLYSYCTPTVPLLYSYYLPLYGSYVTRLYSAVYAGFKGEIGIVENDNWYSTTYGIHCTHALLLPTAAAGTGAGTSRRGRYTKRTRSGQGPGVGSPGSVGLVRKRRCVSSAMGETEPTRCRPCVRAVLVGACTPRTKVSTLINPCCTAVLYAH